MKKHWYNVLLVLGLCLFVLTACDSSLTSEDGNTSLSYVVPVDVYRTCEGPGDIYSPPPLFASGVLLGAQSQDEYLQMALESICPCIFNELDAEEILEFRDEFLYMLNMEGMPIEKYLEDFDYLVENVEIFAYLDTTGLRYQIENFFHMNEHIFYQLLMSAIWSGGVFDDFDFRSIVPVIVQPYRDLVLLGTRWSASSYIVTPNRLILIAFDVEQL